MNIGIDISQIIYEGTGVSRFTYQLVKKILSSDTGHSWTFFFSSLKHGLHADIVQEIASRDFKLIRWPIPPRLLSVIWNDSNIRQHSPIPTIFDLFISSDWTQPPPKIAQYSSTIVHDLVFKEHPDTVDPLILDTQTKRLEHVVRECQIIWCDSESTIQDLKKYYPNTKGMVRLNYPGVLAPTLDKKNIFTYDFKPGEYFFSVGKIEPRKNLNRLIQSFLQLIDQPRYQKLSLVIAGPQGWDTEIEKFKHPQIYLLGSVDDSHLALLYKEALAFVYPSIYEGFGIPPLEAMSLGCPVIMSNTSSLSEIGTPQSNLFIDPYSVEELTQAMQQIADNKQLRDSLINGGYSNIKHFTWDMYLQNMLKSINTLESCEK